MNMYKGPEVYHQDPNKLLATSASLLLLFLSFFGFSFGFGFAGLSVWETYKLIQSKQNTMREEDGLSKLLLMLKRIQTCNIFPTDEKSNCTLTINDFHSSFFGPSAVIDGCNWSRTCRKIWTSTTASRAAYSSCLAILL